MSQNRPNWDEYFLGMAHYVSIRSHDSQTKVGCVIVGSPNVVVGVGYNGFCTNVKEENRLITLRHILHTCPVPVAQNCFGKAAYRSGLFQRGLRLMENKKKTELSTTTS